MSHPAPATIRRACARRHGWATSAPLVLVGVLAGALAVPLASASGVVIVLALGALAVVSAVLWIRSADRIATLLIAFLAFSLPINLDFNLLYRPHVGGAPSLTINLTVLGLMVFVLVWFHRGMRGLNPRMVVAHPPLAWAALAILFVPMLSLVNADYPGLAWLEWFRLGCLVVALFAVMNLHRESWQRLWVWMLSLQVALQGALALLQYGLQRSLGLALFGEQSMGAHEIGFLANRATGTIGHPNVLSYFFEILLPVMFALVLVKQPVRHRIWFVVVCLLGLGGLMTTLSRGAWATVPLSFGMVFVLLYGLRVFRVKAMAALALVGLGVLASAYFTYPIIERRLTHSDYKSGASRMPLNRAAWSIAKQFPIAGLGLNAFAEGFKRYDKTGYSRIFRGYRHVVHNMYLWIWVEVGLLGLLAYLAPFVVAIGVALRHAPRAPPVPRAILVGIAAGLLAHLLHGLLDPGFRVSLSISFLVFTSMGLVGALAIRYPLHGRAA